MGQTIEDHPVMQGQYVLKGHTPIHPFFQDHQAPIISTPSEWFGSEFPHLTHWGPPFLEVRYSTPGQADRIRPVSMNVDWMAAMLGGQKLLGHDVVYFKAEELFYFLDWDGSYVPTSEEKLKTVLSQQLIRCAETLQKSVDFEWLFIKYRSKEQLDEVIQKAKSVLAVRKDFFQGDQGARRRIDGKVIEPEITSPHALFIDQQVIPKKDALLLIDEFWNYFEQFCEFKGIPKTARKHLRKETAAMIKEKHGASLRKDLKGEDGRWLVGWKHLAVSPIGMVGNRSQLAPETSFGAGVALARR